MQIQWKSVGALAGSFNLLVYGISMALFERLGGDKKYSNSKAAFALFYLGLLNTFTNYTHHTYHLPQGLTQKWIAFIVSMLEIIIFLKLLVTLLQNIKSRKRGDKSGLTLKLLFSSRWWTLANLLLALLISIPPLNTLIHGTHVVMAHAMGSMIGIDSLVLLASIVFVIETLTGQKVKSIGTLELRMFHLSLSVLLSTLVILGTENGIYRYLDLPSPDWTHYLYFILVPSGLALCVCLLLISVKLILPIGVIFKRKIS